jgi:ribonuclease BN (tRNA processing enzyme)
VKLTVVGCAGSFPTPSSPASCYLVEHDGARILLDLGNGAFGALADHIDIDDPDALAGVVLSHCHIDHCADVASVYVHRHYHPRARFMPLPLLGPRETAARIAAIYGLRSPDELARVFDVRAFGEERAQVGPFTVDVVRAAHPVEAYSIRVEAGGVSIVYSGDTGPNTRLAELARGADIALFEASYDHDDHVPDLHMSGGDAGAAASAADVGLLVLTHIPVWTDAERVLAGAAARFDGPIELARPGLSISIEDDEVGA